MDYETFVRRYIKNGIRLIKTRGMRRSSIIAYKLLKTKILGYPMEITIEPAGICNLKCPMCLLNKSKTDIERQKKVLKFKDYKKIIDDVKDFVVHISLYYAGEPLLNPDIFRMVNYADKNNIDTLIATNATLLNKENRKKLLSCGLQRIILSIDGATKKTYKKYRVGADFDKVIENIRKLVKERGNRRLPVIALQTIATKKTLKEFKKYKKLAIDLGIDEAYVTRMYIDQYKQKVPKNVLKDVIIGGKWSRYKKIKNGRLIPKTYVKSCPSLHHTHILSDGTVLHCCYDTRGEYTFGNAIKNNFKDIWNSKKYRHFRNKLAKPMILPLCKESCTPAESHYIFLYKKYPEER